MHKVVIDPAKWRKHFLFNRDDKKSCALGHYLLSLGLNSEHLVPTNVKFKEATVGKVMFENGEFYDWARQIVSINDNCDSISKEVVDFMNVYSMPHGVEFVLKDTDEN